MIRDEIKADGHECNIFPSDFRVAQGFWRRVDVYRWQIYVEINDLASGRFIREEISRWDTLTDCGRHGIEIDVNHSNGFSSWIEAHAKYPAKQTVNDDDELAEPPPTNQEGALPMTTLTVEALAKEIESAGNWAGSFDLAEAILPFIQSRAAGVQGVGVIRFDYTDGEGREQSKIITHDEMRQRYADMRDEAHRTPPKDAGAVTLPDKYYMDAHGGMFVDNETEHAHWMRSADVIRYGDAREAAARDEMK